MRVGPEGPAAQFEGFESRVEQVEGGAGGGRIGGSSEGRGRVEAEGWRLGGLEGGDVLSLSTRLPL